MRFNIVRSHLSQHFKLSEPKCRGNTVYTGFCYEHTHKIHIPSLKYYFLETMLSIMPTLQSDIFYLYFLSSAYRVQLSVFRTLIYGQSLSISDKSMH